MPKHLIVNADDFGLCTGVNSGIIRCFEHGIVTSCSLMVRWPHAADAAFYARSHPNLGVGLHVDLGEWEYTEKEWKPKYEVVSTEDSDAVTREIVRQLDQFQSLLQRKPTHLDSHQHVHRKEPARSIMMTMARELQIPLRHFSEDIRYCGAFYGQNETGETLPSSITPTALIQILSSMQEGYTELCCHPGSSLDISTMYSDERVLEVDTLCAHEVLEEIRLQNIHLCSFSTLPHSEDRVV